jgi:excinuclease ABC subunit C
LAKLDVDIPVIALAKREETIFMPRRRPVMLPGDSLGLKLLQRVRDEAHRFAVAYHRQLRGKAAFEKG